MNLESTKCVLLIGTNAADTQLVAQALANDPREEFAIEHASQVSVGLDRINRPGVRAVILDMEMAGGRGIAAFEKLHSAAPDLPILILTSPKHENLVRQTANCDVHDYLLKAQLKEYRLRRAVRQLIARKAAEDAAFQKQQCAEAALSCTGDAVLVSDCAGQIRELNTAAELLDRMDPRRSLRAFVARSAPDSGRCDTATGGQSGGHVGSSTNRASGGKLCCPPARWG